MPKEKIVNILKATTDLSDEDIDGMSDAECWRLVYRMHPPKKEKKDNEICFIGFRRSEKKHLTEIAKDHGLTVVKSVTKTLRYLCAGPNVGPVQLKNARGQDVFIITEQQLHLLFETGDLPDREDVTLTAPAYTGRKLI